MTQPSIESFKNLRLLFDITGWPTHVNRVTYSDLKNVVEGVSMKMIREGFVGFSRFPAPLFGYCLIERHLSSITRLIELPNKPSHPKVLTPFHEQQRRKCRYRRRQQPGQPTQPWLGTVTLIGQEI